MSSKKEINITRQCRIGQWIKAQDKDFLDAIENRCISLSPAKSAPGITFLYPKENSFRKEIIEKAYSDKPEEAIQLIKSLIIPDFFTSSADFSSKEVGNKLGIKIPIKAATDDKIIFENDMEIIPAKDFSPIPPYNDSLAVWIITKGRPPLEGETYKFPRKARPRRRKGGDDTARSPTIKALGPRAQTAVRTETEFQRCLTTRNPVENCRMHEPYLARVVSILNFLSENYENTLIKILPILSYDPIISFYLILEPYKKSGEYLIPTEQLYSDNPGNPAWNEPNYYGNKNDMEDFLGYFKKIPGLTSLSATDPNFSLNAVQPKIFQDIQALRAQIQLIRQDLLEEDLADLPKNVKKCYIILANENKLSTGFGPIYPDSTHASLGGLKKLWQDEFRFFMYHALKGMRQDQQAGEDFKNIIICLRELWSGDDYEKETILTNEKYQNSTVYPPQDLMSLKKFVQSSDFLYMPFPQSGGGARRVGGASNGAKMVDHNAGSYSDLLASHVAPPQEAPGRDYLNEMRDYVARYKKLPQEISSLWDSLKPIGPA